MADINPKPAPRNVSSINGQQGIDISGVGVYDENTSLDDISGAYTGVGKQLGTIVNQAAQHVGDIQAEKIGNDFGAVNPYMYDTYYEPGANDIQSDWRMRGTQKALEVGMERGKKAAEEAAKAAKNNYTEAVNNFNQAVTKPMVATVDTSLLGEYNTVDEFSHIEDYVGGDKEAIVNQKLKENVVDKVNVEWDDKSARWADAAQATMNHMGVTQEQYDSWTPEEQQAMWDSQEASKFFNNYYTEDYIAKTMGEDSLNKYRQSYADIEKAIGKIYDYANGLTQELELDPITVISRSYADLNTKNELADAWVKVMGFEGDGTVSVEKYVFQQEWLDKNIRQDKQDEFKKWVEANWTEDTSSGSSMSIVNSSVLDKVAGVTNHRINKQDLAEFAKDKLTDEALSFQGVKIGEMNKILSRQNNGADEERSLFGFDIDSLRWYKSMKDEHPEILDTLSSQISQAYGATSTMEIADGKHWYLINGEYKQPEAGTVILFAMPGVVNNDGTYNNKDFETFVDCFTKLNNSAATYSDEEISNLQKTAQEAWNNYFESIYTMKIAETFTGTTMDEDLYKSIMYRIDPSKYDGLTVNGKPVKEIVSEWRKLGESDGHKAYVQLSQLLKQAYSKLGFFYAMDAYGRLVEYDLTIGDTGKDSVGQVGGEDDPNPYAGMGAGEAMALFNIVTASMQEYQRGNNQDKNIKPEFIDDDNSGWIQDHFNAMLNAFGGTIDLVSAGLTTVVANVGNLFLSEDEKVDPADVKGFSFRNALAAIAPANWGKEYQADLLTKGVSWNELWTEGPREGTMDYFVQMSNLQQQNLADAINPFLMEAWFPDEGKEADYTAIKRIGEGYTSRVKPLVDLGNLQTFDVYGLSTMFANGTAFSEATAKLTGGLVGGYMTGWMTTGVKYAAALGMAKVNRTANAIKDKIVEAMAISQIKNTSNETIAKGIGQKIMVQTAEQQAAKSTFSGVKELGTGQIKPTPKGALNQTAQKGMTTTNQYRDMALRGVTELGVSDKLPELTEGFSTEFMEHSLGGSKTAAPLAAKAFTTEQAQVIAAAEKAVGQEMSEAIMRETLQRTSLALGTGLPSEAFSAMNSATQKLFTKAFNAAVNGTSSGAIGGAINPVNFLRSLGVDGIKEAATEVAKESVAAAARGMKWTSADTFRVLSRLGWDGASTRALLADFTKDFYTDMIRDTMRNASNAYLTNEGWQKQDLGEYFANPWTYMQNVTFSAIHFGGQRIKAQVADSFYSHKYNKALDAYSAVGDNPEAQAKALDRLNGIINKIQENSNTLLRRGQPYSKLKTSSEKINDDLNYIITKQYEKSGINPITGDSTNRFESADDFNDYLKNRRMSEEEKINIALRGLTIETQNNYIMSRYELGGSDQTKLGNIKNWEVNWDMQDIEQRTLADNYDTVIKMKGSPLDKQRRMYQLYTDAIMAKYGKVIPGLEAALGNYYGKYLTDLEATLAKNPKAQWTLGYTSFAGMTTLGDDSGDVMFGASFGNNFNTVDRNAADVDKSRAHRDIKRQLLDAIKEGKDELEITKADGTKKVYKLNKDGLNYLKTLTAYNNSNTVHKYFDPIFGDNIQTREHQDQKPYAQVAYEHQDAIISSTKVATQAAEADAAKATKIREEYRNIAYERAKASGNEEILRQRHEAITKQNQAINVNDSENIYKAANDRAAAERYLATIDEEKHGALQKRYKEVLPMIAQIDGELGKAYAKREYQQGLDNTKNAINAYVNGELTLDNPVFKMKYGENETVDVTLDPDTMSMISEAAKNGQEFSSDLTLAMISAKRGAVDDRPSPLSEEMARGDYTRVIKDLEYDAKTNETNNTAAIIKLRQEMRENNIRHVNARSGKRGEKTSVTDYGFKEIKGTELDTATTGFKIDGKDQLVKNAADDYYYLPRAGEKSTHEDSRARVMAAATEPITDFLKEGTNGLTKEGERMVAYVTNAAEQNLRNADMDERITVGTLKREIMRAAPDADLWMTAEESGLVKTAANLSKLGIQPEVMISELKTILASNSTMPEFIKTRFVDAINLYTLISENSNSIKANAFSLNQLVGNEEGSTMADVYTGDNELVSSTKNMEMYDKDTLKRMVQHTGDILTRINNPNSKFSSELIKKLKTERTSSSNIAKAVKNDLRATAFDYYNKAVQTPTELNTPYVDAVNSWAKARYAADPKLSGKPVVPNDIDCINALGSATHEVMLSPYGDKDNHTYAEYMAAQNNVRDYTPGADGGMYSAKAKDYIRLTNATYGQSVEQAQRSIDNLIAFFPDDKGVLLEKKNGYALDGNRIASQYMSETQLKNRVKATSGETLEEYGLGNLPANRYTDAFKAAGRLKRIQKEAQLFASGKANQYTPKKNNSLEELYATVNDEALRSARRQLDVMDPEHAEARYNELAQQGPSAYRNRTLLDSVIESKNARKAQLAREAGQGVRNDRAAIVGNAIDTSIIPSTASKEDYALMLKNARKELGQYYKESGLNSGKRVVSYAEIDEFCDKVLQAHDAVVSGTGNSIANDLITLNNARGDNTENALISVMAQTYDSSSRAVYDAQEKILNDRLANIKRRKSTLTADSKSVVPESNNVEALRNFGDSEALANNYVKAAESQQTNYTGSKTYEPKVDIKPVDIDTEAYPQMANKTGEFEITITDRQGKTHTINAYLGDKTVDTMPVPAEGAPDIDTEAYPQMKNVADLHVSLEPIDVDTEAYPHMKKADGMYSVVIRDNNGKVEFVEDVYLGKDVQQEGERVTAKDIPEQYQSTVADNLTGTMDDIVRRNRESEVLLNQQLAETQAAITKHHLLDYEAMIRDGKTHFYTDKQIMAGEFGRDEVNNIRTQYRSNNYPVGLEMGEGKIVYTVELPTEQSTPTVSAPVNTFEAQSQASSESVPQPVQNEPVKISPADYAKTKAKEIYDRFSDYGVYENMRFDGSDWIDNGDGTITIYGRYGYGDMGLHEQEQAKINKWENIDTSDIDAERRAILQLSTSPIYQSYDEMLDLKKVEELIAQRRALTEEEQQNQQLILDLNARKKSTYDQYIQLTNALGKEYLDGMDALRNYQKAVKKERASYKIDDLDESMVKAMLTDEEYADYIDANQTLFNVARFQNSSDNGIYHAKNGILFAKDGYNPQGFVDTSIAKAILEGKAVDTNALEGDALTEELNTKENRKARKQMQKEINANQNKGAIHWKNAEAYKAVKESAMDKLSARYTLNNYIEFENQTRDILTNMGTAEEYKILMAKDYSDMMQRIAGKDGGIENQKVVGKFYDLMTHTANLNKTIQDWQLAGGFSNYNAATIAQIRGAIFNDPRMALEYVKVFTAAKNSNSTMNYVVQNREFLYKMVGYVGDGSLVTDLNAAISAQPGGEDMGTINSLTTRILDHLSGDREVEGKNSISRGFGRIADDMNAIFSDATFRNTFPLFKLRMLQINYDEALRYFKKFKGWESYSAKDLEEACMKMAYAKTMDFLEPRKTRGQTYNEFIDSISNDQFKKAAASWTGAKRGDSLMDQAGSVFFALRWKMTFGGRVLNGLTNTPGALIRRAQLHNADISDSDTLAKAQTQFMRRGNTVGVGAMLALSSIAMLWNRSLGYDSVSWDDLNPIGEDGEFQVPNILLKLQTLGQFWLPNSVDENGNPIIDPTKKGQVIDPFSSIFTMSNTIAKATDKWLNPNAYALGTQRGILGSESSSDAINQVINSPFVKAFGDELIGANLLSPYKAMYEFLVDDTYFGNNIWEKKKLADGSTNPNYDPFRNLVASVAHILNFDWMLSGGTNKWVKGYGTDSYENSGKIGTVAGSGVFQHEFVTAAINILNGDALEGLIEAGELPIKTSSISGKARTDFNVRVKNIIAQYVQEYKDKVGPLTNVDAKDAEYAKLVKRCADVVANWSAKNEYALGRDQELVAYVTKTLMALCAGEYNDNLDYVQNAYWKASEIAQIEHSEELFLSDPDLERYIAEGKTVEEFAAEKNRRSEAYNQAIDDEYQARKALKEAGLPDSYLQAYEDVYGSTAKTDFKTEMRAVNKKVFTQIHGVLESPIGEFKNFKEMKEYYEAQIEAANSTKSKAKLADKYNDILKDAIAPYINEYGAAILSDGYYNSQNLANSIAEYVILPADEYYYGKTPRASYLRDQFHVGYRDKSALPSDKEVYELYTNALKKIHNGASASAVQMLDRLIRDYRNGRIYISDADYTKIVRLKSQINARSNQ